MHSAIPSILSTNIMANGKAVLDRKQNPKKRLLFSGHYDECVPLTDLANNSDAQVTEGNTEKSFKRGRSTKNNTKQMPEADCGQSSTVGFRQPRSMPSLGRIVNGKESPRGRWPWQVSLQLLHPRFGFLGHWCGAVLVAPRWVLSAAHCVHNELFQLPIAALWTAVVGDWDLRRVEPGEQRVPVDKVLLHEGFRHYQNDIALFQLSRAVNMTGDDVRAICLPDAATPLPTSELCVATGWGQTQPQGPLASTLLETHIPVHPNAVCHSKYSPAIPIRAGHLCAGHLDGTSGTCVGDSGGPLQCRSPDGRWFLAGITSFGSGCAKVGFPDVYTRLTFYLPWIRDKVNNSDMDTT